MVRAYITEAGQPKDSPLLASFQVMSGGNVRSLGGFQNQKLKESNYTPNPHPNLPAASKRSSEAGMVRDRHQKPMSLGGGATTPNTTPPPTHGQFLAVKKTRVGWLQMLTMPATT